MVEGTGFENRQARKGLESSNLSSSAHKIMKILAIETSCDETAICLLECSGSLPSPSFKVIANSLISQIDIHKEYGGVFPMLAKREHTKNLPIILDKVLKDAGEDPKKPEIDYIAVTSGPGLEPALWTGIVFAEELGQRWGKKVIPINHMEGHLFSSIFENTDPLEFPAIALLVSGGHTELVLVEDFDKFRIIGRTRDDAVGEAFDKVARLLDLPYPGGPKISELADRARERNTKGVFNFPRPMMKTNDFDFSYSGLKTSVLYAMQKLDSINTETKEDIALGFEEAAIEPLIYKTKKAIEEFGVRTIILGGGVSANTYLQSELNKLSNEYGLPLHLPKKDLSTDNAIMIAVAAYIRVTTNRETTPEKIIARGNLSLEA